MSERVTRRLRIEGRVQGVWFRESMRQEAESLGITGWVRNRLDGSVEAVVQGGPEAVAAITAWARRGPDHAEVRRLEEFEEPAGGFTAFEKKPTG
jgi:acylphosphatase